MNFTDFFDPSFSYAITHMESNRIHAEKQIQIEATDEYNLKKEDTHYSITMERFLKVVDSDKKFSSVSASIILKVRDGVTDIPNDENEIIDAFIEFVKSSTNGAKLYAQVSFAISSMTSIMNDPPIVTPPIPFSTRNGKREV